MPVDPDTLSQLSTRPGVYLFRDAAGEILYVGKARNLRSRVRSYFRGGDVDAAPGSIKLHELSRRAESVETIVVGGDAEALILEANLIKEHRPRFNIQLRDDKRYPYVKVTLQEPFPRVFVTRQVKNDGARYFGPYASVGPMRQALAVIKGLYTVRSCRYDLPDESPARACLDYHIGRCKAPCVGLQSREEYGEMVEEILRILGGRTEGIRRDVAEEMAEAAESLEFERAARLRDILEGLDALAREQRVEKVGGGDHDAVGLARDRELAVAVVMKIRGGVLLGRDTHRFGGIRSEDDEALLASFASRYYLGGGETRIAELPGEVLLPADFEDRKTLEDVLSEAAGRRVHLRVPQRGEKVRLVELAATNARHVLEDRVSALAYASDRADETLYELQDRLDLKVVPRLVVCFDVSHIQGSETVGSAVVFENGEPKKSEYRHMRITGEEGNDDYRSMAEVVSRWFRRRVEEEERLPDLVLIDGGKGQLRAARRALEELELADVAVAALAKREEEVYLPGRPEPLRLEARNRALHLLQRTRNEAHRFAVSYNRKLRKKRTIRSRLRDVPGIGPNRQRALLARFGSVREIRRASEDEISRVPGFSEVLAARLKAYLG